MSVPFPIGVWALCGVDVSLGGLATYGDHLMATLKDFLETAALGPIAEGLSPEQVRAILGEPDDVSQSKNPIWKYGALQLGFYKDKGTSDSKLTVVFIGLYYRMPSEAVPKALGLTGWLPSAATTGQEFKDYLASVSLTASSDTAFEGEDQLVLPSGVRLVFDAGKLDSIQFAARFKERTRQLSVSLPDHVVKVIRKEASRKSISASALCAEWILQHVNNGAGSVAS
jgi:hypothetical protein